MMMLLWRMAQTPPTSSAAATTMPPQQGEPSTAVHKDHHRHHRRRHPQLQSRLLSLQVLREAATMILAKEHSRRYQRHAAAASSSRNSKSLHQKKLFMEVNVATERLLRECDNNTDVVLDDDDHHVDGNVNVNAKNASATGTTTTTATTMFTSWMRIMARALLHLACASDTPVALAKLFVTLANANANASSTTTATTATMAEKQDNEQAQRCCHYEFAVLVSEAAINGASQVLSLLLEHEQDLLWGLASATSSSTTASSLPQQEQQPAAVDTNSSRSSSSSFRPVRLVRSGVLDFLERCIDKLDSGLRRTRRIRDDDDSCYKVEQLVLHNNSNNNNVQDGGSADATASTTAAPSLSEVDRARALLKEYYDHNSAGHRHSPSTDCHTWWKKSPVASEGGSTPLHWAAFKGEVECVKLLLRQDHHPTRTSMNVNVRSNPSGWTPLHDAAYSNAHEIVALLLEHGANVNAQAYCTGATPLCLAAQEDAAEAASILLRYGADLTLQCEPPLQNRRTRNTSSTSSTSSGGIHPRMRYTSSSSSNIIAGLIGGGGLAGAAGSSSRHHHYLALRGFTPLHYCAKFNSVRAARVLLKHKSASVALQTPDAMGRLPIHIACLRGSGNVLYELLHFGARVVQVIVPKQLAATATSTTGRSDTAYYCPNSSMKMPSSLYLPLLGEAETSESLHPTNKSINNKNDPLPPLPPPPTCSELRSLIPTHPVHSAKPWNCLTQQSIDDCHNLLHQISDSGWSRHVHSLYTPHDRRVVLEILNVVAPSLEQNKEHGIFLDLWPQVLSYCGRGWFDQQPYDITVPTL